MTIEGQLTRPFQLEGRRVWVAGNQGMVGQALTRRLSQEKCQILTCERADVDLRRQSDTENWVATNRPDVVLLAAATVGGLFASETRPAEFIYDNLAIELNVMEAARRAKVTKLLLLGSSCIYPRLAEQPMPESALLSGSLEPSNQWYAVAKIAGIKLCQAYRRQHEMDCVSVLPTNLYGPGENFFDPNNSHVLPALLRKIQVETERIGEVVEIWGTGEPRRDFLHVDDCADAIVHVLKHYSGEEPINIGSGSDVTIRELAHTLARIVGYSGTFFFDTSLSDGTPRKLLDVRRLASLGWTARISLEDGLRSTYRWYCENAARSASATRGLDPICGTRELV